ncbi:hypothetical protein HYDPIDRAFT_137355 [Hydnomerulius pinastri MD-312]|uniref:Elongation of fatty acids protein n=1 Tax=Hydnomerulius pinastri MD-312 TaxID=994086 RepID=A0A0C9W572_9AGAM|nr:hypothetical protein HYDPIDRAFT_137355 [Hydnomerulius pinastri MD-312]
MVLLANFLLTVVPTASMPTWLTSYVPGQTPLSTWPVVSTTILSYLAIVFGLREFMEGRRAFSLRTPTRIHNALLSAGSLILLALMMEEVASAWGKVGAYGAMCASSAWTSRLEFYYMINYYLKYVEFMDTVILALKKRPLSFLHVFHHATTALLTFIQLNGKISGAWIVISINLAVHVAMYYYYFAAAGGAKIWARSSFPFGSTFPDAILQWKKYLTTMQIVQFIIDLFVLYFGLYQHFVFKYWPHLPHIGDCVGDERSAIFGAVLIGSFLVLFTNFYAQTYKGPSNEREAKNVTGKSALSGQVPQNGVLNGERTR